MKLHWLLPGLAGLFLLSTSAEAATLQTWRFDRNQQTIELKTDDGVQPQAFVISNPGRLVIDLPNTKLKQPKQMEVVGTSIHSLRIAQYDADTTRLVVELAPGYIVEPNQVRLQYSTAKQWTVRLPSPRYKPDVAQTTQPTQMVSVPRAPGVPVVVRTQPIQPVVPVSTRPVATVPPVVTPPRPQPTPAQPQPTTPQPRPNVGRAVVVIDPGHGGPDVGAVGVGGLRETEVNLAISKQVAALLERQGIKTILTRTSEVNLELEPRVQIAEDANATVFVSIHSNSFSGSSANGVETYYYQSGQELAQTIQRSVLESVNMRDRGVKQARFYVIRYTSMPAVLVEVGFVTGSEDGPRMATTAFRNQMADAIAKGIVRYLGTSSASR